MKFKVSNLGAIKEGEIDLSKKFIVFCGPNGTGKTYFAYVIYGLLSRKLHVPDSLNLADALAENRKVEYDIDFDNLIQYRSKMIELSNTNIGELFGIGEKEKIKLFSSFSCQFSNSDDEFQKYLIDAEISKICDIDDVLVKIEKQTGSSKLFLTLLDDNPTTESIRKLKSLLNTFLYYYLILFPINDVVIFPVERNSIYTFSKELSVRKQEALDNMLLLMDNEKKVNRYDLYFNNRRYPLPIRDGLIIAENLSEIRKQQSPTHDFSLSLEEKLLHGKVQISKDGEIQFKPKNSPGIILPIKMTASIIKTLSSLDVYLKHMSSEDDLIIIDEPEINLHPDNQILVARMLVRLMNSGYRILLSTHSDYIIREVNNMVMAKALQQKDPRENIRKNYGYLDKELLNSSDVDAYYFNPKKEGWVEVEKLEVNDYGFDVKSINEAIDTQNSITNDLYDRLTYGVTDYANR